MDSIPDAPITTALRLEKRFNRVLSAEEVGNLPQKDFVDYLRENLWDKWAVKLYGKPYDTLVWTEKVDVDLNAMLEIAKVFNEVK